jgi:hypothetical protein
MILIVFSAKPFQSIFENEIDPMPLRFLDSFLNYNATAISYFPKVITLWKINS